jgi:hypothetical protein
MTWKPSADIDEKVRGWMKAKGWQVTSTDYHFDQEIYSWRKDDSPRALLGWSIPIDENNDGMRSGTEEYAFIAADRCNDGDANVGRVDGDDDPTCFVDHKGVAYDNWDAFAGAHPTWRIARRESGGTSPAFTFVIIDQPAHYVVWLVQAQ